MVKAYVLDTNILMSTEGRAINGFDDNNIILTSTVLEELDRLKTSPGERGYQARASIRIIKSIIGNEIPKTGVKLPSGGHIHVYIDDSKEQLPKGWDGSRPDNIILSTCLKLKSLFENKEESSWTLGEVILITNDNSFAVKAIMLGITVQEYRNDVTNSEEEYTGRTGIIRTDEEINELYKTKEIESFSEEILENQFVCVTNELKNHSALTWNRKGSLQLIRDFKNPIFGIRPKNMGQRYALEALLAPAEEIPLVILKGPAGSGKTILSVAAGLDGVYDSEENKKYDSLVITRSNTLSDEDLGFLPGDLEDKMAPLLAPFFDNLKYLLSHNGEDKREVTIQMEDMITSGIIEVASLSYIRGRSLANTYLIVDEAQNLTRLQAKTIVTRMGMGSKLVLLGDPGQIDNPKLDKKNNGLVYLSEKFMGNSLCAQMSFESDECVRSALAEEAVKIL